MPQISEKITINRPVTAVFQIVADSNRWREWQPDVTDGHYSENKLRVGAMIMQSRNTYALGWKLDLNADIVDYAPNRLIAYKGVAGRFNVTGRIEFDGSGTTTNVSETIDIRIGFLHVLFSSFITGAMRRRTKAALAQLKAVAEGER